MAAPTPASTLIAGLSGTEAGGFTWAMYVAVAA
jgi:hypothetical protein